MISEGPCPTGQRYIASTAGNADLTIFRKNDVEDTEPMAAAFGSETTYSMPAGDNIWIEPVDGQQFDLYSVSLTVQNVNSIRVVLMANDSTKPNVVHVSKGKCLVGCLCMTSFCNILCFIYALEEV